MTGASYALAVLVGCLSVPVVLNLCSPNQRMIEYYEPFDLVGSYGVFGTVTQNPGWTTRHVIVLEGTSGADPDAETGWKEYRWLAQPSDPAVAPVQIAPYQPHLDWDLWFAPMGSPSDFPWMVSLVAKLLHNDPLALSLIGPNPFPRRAAALHPRRLLHLRVRQARQSAARLLDPPAPGPLAARPLRRRSPPQRISPGRRPESPVTPVGLPGDGRKATDWTRRHEADEEQEGEKGHRSKFRPSLSS